PRAHLAELDLVAGLEALGFERRDDSHRAQALLDVLERVAVLEVVPVHEPLDRGALDPEHVVARALDAVAIALPGPVHDMVGNCLPRNRGWARTLLGRDVREDLARKAVDTNAGGARHGQHRRVVPK